MKLINLDQLQVLNANVFQTIMILIQLIITQYAKYVNIAVKTVSIQEQAQPALHVIN